MDCYDGTNKPFLDYSVIDEFREVINSSPIFVNHVDYEHSFNLICVFMERIDSSVRFLNAHSDMPETEEEFIEFVVFSAILRDGINKLYENVFHQKPPYVGEKKYFKDTVDYGYHSFMDDTCPSDEDFFEYLRAIIFAHPFETSSRGNARPFMKKNEKHYCPFVLISSPSAIFRGKKDAVGAQLYSNSKEKTVTSVVFPFSAIKEYIASRYDCIHDLTERARQGIIIQTQKWGRTRINRDQEPIEILKEIAAILKERFENTDTIETTIGYLECPLSESGNENAVAIFRSAILHTIPTVCDCVEAFDYIGMEDALYLLYVRPPKMHQMAYYQLEKIMTYLDCRSDTIDPQSNEYWGLSQAEAFSREFAQKWVTIDVEQMPYNEIKLLVQVACFLEAQDQKAITG